MTWPPGKIAPCASCDRIKPLRVVDTTPICANCAHELVDDQEASTSPTATVATDGGQRR